MKHDIENIRLPQQAKDQLSKLKRVTGIEQWNILCRWALALSLAESNHPPKNKPATDSSIDINWKTFSGDKGAIYYALLVDRCKKEGMEIKTDNLTWLLRRHLVRGIGYLTARRELKSIDGLLIIACDKD
ncbi:MAG: DNA sulfur modification protein DndE [Coraliomargaritaceae bacterium]